MMSSGLFLANGYFLAPEVGYLVGFSNVLSGA